MYDTDGRKQQLDFIDGLKQGDEIAILRRTHDFGRKSFSYYTHEIVSRISPKRTKIVLESGKELERREINSVFPPTDLTRQSEINIQKRNEIHEHISSLTLTNGKCNSLSFENFKDEDLDAALKCLQKLFGMLKK